MKVKPLVLILLAITASVLLYRLNQSRDATRISGTVEADEVRVGSRTGGRVVELGAREGDLLTNGQVIARLSAPEVVARRDRAAAYLRELENGPRREDLDTARANWEALQAEYINARDNALRKTAMHEKKVVSDEEYDTSVARAAALEKQAAAAEAKLRELEAGTRPEQLQQARAQLAELDALLAENQATAPAGARLEVLHMRVGDLAAPNASIATLVLEQPLWVRVYIPAPWLGHVAVGDPAEIRVDAYSGEVFHGRVDQVNRSAEFTPRNVQTVEERVKQVFGVKVVIDDHGGRLQPGMSADVDFPQRDQD